jgi:hypothetical protein
LTGVCGQMRGAIARHFAENTEWQMGLSMSRRTHPPNSPSGGDPARPPAQYLSNIEHTQAGPSLRFRNQVEK